IVAPINTEYFLLGLSIMVIGILIVLFLANFKLFSVYNFLNSNSILDAAAAAGYGHDVGDVAVSLCSLHQT
ncbi:MAG: hypothetical protein II755_07340, partial [Prevotella sp.]|nr:hypothetical protein [Prevotella sp.]